MPAPREVLVIGGGVAGASAALAAVAAGARVTLVRAGPGASALAGGGWRGAVPAQFAAGLAAVGHPLLPCPSALPHVNGFLDRADTAPGWHAGARPERGGLVCGIVGLSSFRANFLAQAWAPGDGRLGAAQIELRETPSGGWSAVAAAAAAARAAEWLGEAIGALARDRDVTTVILPPVLGLDDVGDTWRRVSDSAGVPVGEAVGGWPSVPGWRLDRALLLALAAADVEVLSDRVVAAERAGGRVTVIRLAGGRELRASAVVLATGKFTGGGVSAAPALREPVLGLRIGIERIGQEFAEASPLLTTELDRAANQPLLRAGVHADEAGRVLHLEDGTAATNVRIGGSLRAGWDTAETGLGDAASDGWVAGLSAVEAV